MTQLTEFFDQLPNYIGIFALMFSTFVIGYFTAFSQQKNKYKKILKRFQEKQNPKSTPKTVADIETIFSEIKPKIVEVVKETQKNTTQQSNSTISKPKTDTILTTSNDSEENSQTKSPERIMEEARMSYVNYSMSKPKLNFENFGYGNAENKDDLTKINGIGPYIEQRLNEIGIYNYDQISKFKEEDIRILTDLIDFFPDRIERDSWVAQAASLKY